MKPTQPTKTFKLRADQTKPLVQYRGACFATDRITVEGKRVGYMYREKPDATSKVLDTGWRFQAGDESQTYMDDPHNSAIYDVNTIANYDPDIIPLLDAPIGSAFERDGTTGRLLATDPPPDD